MGLKEISLVLLVIGCAAAQTYRVCIPATDGPTCSNLERDDSQVTCNRVESRVDCAIRLARGEADIGVFNEEETILLGQQQPNDNRVVATIRDAARTETTAFEAVAVVPLSHSGGLEGLRGGQYCHPGFDQSDTRWSPRVLRTFEQRVAGTDRCANLETAGKSADELEVETLNGFFGAACRPGRWSANVTVDANLKSRFPNLCSLCGPTTNTTCAGYSINMGVAVASIDNNNRHIQALECMRSSGNRAVAFVAWQHVREYFQTRNPQDAGNFAVLCIDGSTRPVAAELNSSTAPCTFVRQNWGTIVASTSLAAAIQNNIRNWWPGGVNPGGSTWQTVLYNSLVGAVGGSTARVFFEDSLPTPLNYTSSIRTIPNVDSTATCVPARRWCTLSAAEQTKCNWVRNAAHTLGIQPPISCQLRSNVFDCLTEIKENRLDFIASASNYGYLARQHYNLSPVKLVQNSRNAFTRVGAFVKETTANSNVTRFENLRGKKACFPEYGGIAYVAFVRTAHVRGVISSSECDYARAVGEFFDSACAPGALDASHALGQSNFNATSLCTVCRPTIITPGNSSDFTCAWDFSNRFFGNNGSLACLADPTTDVAFMQMQNIDAHVAQLGLQASQYRALCHNNSLAASTGFAIDDGCLLAHVVDAEVVTRRNDPLHNALNVLLDNLDLYFGYLAESGTQLINLEIFSPFDGVSDLLFKDSAIGLSEPTTASANNASRSYIELFQHLETCTGAAAPTPGLASRNFYSVLTLLVMALLTRFVVY